jgi:hypothetical protein
MTIDGVEIRKGDVLYFLKEGTVKPKYKDGTVVDINEHVKALKIEHGSENRLHRDWMPAAKLVRRVPEEKPAAK